MKKITLALLLFLGSVSLFAQDDFETERSSDEFKTIFREEKGDLFISGFGGPLMYFSAIDDNFAHLMGGGGGVIVNSFFFGGYGVGLTTPIDYKEYDGVTPETIRYMVEYGHGGLWAGVILGRKRPLHLSISSQFGWGAISKRQYAVSDIEAVNTEAIFVVTPIAELEMNFSHFFKMGIGANTSIVRGNGITRTPYSSWDFLKPSVYLAFKFGFFN